MKTKKDKKINEIDYSKMKPYNFKRPDKFSKEQITTIRNVHEHFAGLSTTSLSTRLKSSVSMSLEELSQRSFGDFISKIRATDTVIPFEIDPLGSAMIEIDRTATSSVIEKMYGSGLSEIKEMTRPITEIEQHLINNITDSLMSNMTTAWGFITEVTARRSQIGTTPTIMQTINPNEMVIMLAFSLKVGSANGSITVCLPYITLENIVTKLSPRFFYSKVNRAKSDKDGTQEAGKLFSLLEDIKAKLSITLKTQMHSLMEIDRFKEGDDIPICSLSDLAEININGYQVMEGNLGHNNGKWAIKIRKFTDEQ